MNRKEYLKKWREDNKEHIRHYKKEYAKTHDSSFKKLQDKYKQLQQENKQLKKDNYEHVNYTNKLQRELNEENLQCSKYAIEINDLKEKYNKQVSNWNKLKEGLKSCYDFDKGVLSEDYLECIDNTLDKMQEIEEGSDTNG